MFNSISIVALAGNLLITTKQYNYYDNRKK